MPKTLFCNGFEVGHSKEAFCLIFKYMSPDGTIVESVYIAISPAGAKTLIEQLVAEMKDYEKEHGQVETWNKAGKPNNPPNSQNGRTVNPPMIV